MSDLTASQIRERKGDILNQLARNFNSFRPGQKDDWLNRLEHVTIEALQRVVDKYLEHDPRESEYARDRLPKLSEILRHLPRRPMQGEEAKPNMVYDMDGNYEFLGGLTLKALEWEYRTDIARYIVSFWGKALFYKSQLKALALVNMLDPSVLEPKPLSLEASN